jgi:hypothetical protein
MRGRGLVALAALALAGCGDADPGTQAQPPTPPPVIRLPVFLDGASEPASSWQLDVPVADGWEPVVETGQPIAAITQPFGDDCILLVQVAAAGGTGKPEAPTRRGLGKAENGSRALVVGRPQGDERFSVRFTFGEAQRLVFSGGATGPGGHLFMEFEPDSPPGESAPWLTLTAQGGTEGPGCLTMPVDSAPATVVKALRLMAQSASVRYTQ